MIRRYRTPQSIDCGSAAATAEDATPVRFLPPSRDRRRARLPRHAARDARYMPGIRQIRNRRSACCDPAAASTVAQTRRPIVGREDRTACPRAKRPPRRRDRCRRNPAAPGDSRASAFTIWVLSDRTTPSATEQPRQTVLRPDPNCPIWAASGAGAGGEIMAAFRWRGACGGRRVRLLLIPSGAAAMSRLVLLDQRSGLQLAGKVHSPSGVHHR
jgi:hypothetical protein